MEVLDGVILCWCRVLAVKAMLNHEAIFVEVVQNFVGVLNKHIS